MPDKHHSVTYKGIEAANDSPWLRQLRMIRPLEIVESDEKADVAIIGGGISGIASAYYILKSTEYDVALIESDRIGHGASGHNAGQMVSYFERPFSDIAGEYGLRRAAAAQSDILSAWGLVSDIYREADLKTRKAEFTGYAGIASLEKLKQHLLNKSLRKKAGIDLEKVYVSKNVDISCLAGEYEGLYSRTTPEEIQNMLETNDKRFITVLATKKGLVNSALLCEELAGYMSSKYGERFRLLERTHVREITLYREGCVLKTEANNVSCDRAVLCTNGFRGFNIYNEDGQDIDKWFKEMVKGVVGYMGGMLEEAGRKETASTYFSDSSVRNDAPYYYLTRRNYSYSGDEKNLICAGGPEETLEANDTYSRGRRYLPGARDEIRDFLRAFYRHAPENLELDYAWHGLMGYTRNMLRLIGPDPRNEKLLYNLGCNGVGILPSVYGGKRIAEVLSGREGGDSIFDPRNSI